MGTKPVTRPTSVLFGRGEKGTRTCFVLGNGTEECSGPLGAGIDEADCVMAVV